MLLVSLAICVPALAFYGIFRWTRQDLERQAREFAADLARCTVERERQLGHGVLRDAA